MYNWQVGGWHQTGMLFCFHVKFTDTVKRQKHIPCGSVERIHRIVVSQSLDCPGADPGFLIGAFANPPGGGAKLRFCQNFPKKCMKLQTYWAVGGAPLRSTTVL